jgi:hypothetical protein
VYRLPYPVWRARDLPFGRGILSLPQRGEHALEMYAYDAPTDAPPVERFAGHAGELFDRGMLAFSLTYE